MSLKLSTATGLSEGQGNLNIADNAEVDDSREASSVRSSSFQIDLNFIDDNLTDSQKSILYDAANRWSEIITGDLPDVPIEGFRGLENIDDILIDVSSVFFLDDLGNPDGEGGTLASATVPLPHWLRSDSSLPFYGDIKFDAADIERKDLFDTALHEMGHALGIGTIWDKLGLLDTSSISDPRFTGALATSEYNKIFGLNEPSVPVEADGGPATALSHWRESSLKNELMTGNLDPGVINPLSRITVASLKDLGYDINFSAAGDFYPPAEKGSYSGIGGDFYLSIQPGYGPHKFTDFGGIGAGTNPDAATLSEADILLFNGEGLTARHMLLNQKGEDLVVTFEGVPSVNVTLEDFAIEDFDNLGQGPGTTSDRGNVIFVPQEGDAPNITFDEFEDVFDVVNDDWEKPHVLHRNTVTFLNALDNITSGFNESDDVINGLEGNDILNGLSGDDLLRGGDGNDTLIGSEGNDILVGGAGADRFHINTSGNSIDIIQDFSIADGDVLLIGPENQLGASNLRNLSAENFTLGMSATRNSAQLIYDQSTGSLFFDADGSGVLGQTHIATLTATPALSHNDIFLVG